MILRLIPLILASLILGAHFLRDGLVVLVAVCVLLPFLLLIRRRWVLHLLQGFALAAALVWANTTYALVQSRIETGESWTRMLLILGGVTAFTLYAGYLLRSKSVQQRFPSDSGESDREVGDATGELRE